MRFGAPVREEALNGLIFDGPGVVSILSRRVVRTIRGGEIRFRVGRAAETGKLAEHGAACAPFVGEALAASSRGFSCKA